MATKPWRQIQEQHSKRTPAEREATRGRALRDLELERMTLAQLRRARAFTQETMAEAAGMAQGDVSRLEHRADAYIGTVRRFVEALGGSFRMVVEFPDAAPVEIEGFGGSESGESDSGVHRDSLAARGSIPHERNREIASVSAKNASRAVRESTPR